MPNIAEAVIGFLHQFQNRHDRHTKQSIVREALDLLALHPDSIKLGDWRQICCADIRDAFVEAFRRHGYKVRTFSVLAPGGAYLEYVGRTKQPGHTGFEVDGLVYDPLDPHPRWEPLETYVERAFRVPPGMQLSVKYDE